MNWMSILGICLIVIGTIFSFLGTFRSDKKSQEELTTNIQAKNEVIENINLNNIKLIDQNSELLNSNSDVTNTNRELVGQNSDMLFKIEKYQKDIEEKDKRIKELEETSKKVERGIVSIIQFNGNYFVKQQGSSFATAGTEENILYNQLINLERNKKFSEIIELCDKSIINNSKWYTPYFFKAIALLNIDMKNKEEAVKLLEFVESKTYGDPQYIIPIAKVYYNLGDKEKYNTLMNTIPKELKQELINSQKRETQKREKDKN